MIRINNIIIKLENVISQDRYNSPKVNRLPPWNKLPYTSIYYLWCALLLNTSNLRQLGLRLSSKPRKYSLMQSPNSPEDPITKQSPATSDAEQWVDDYGDYLFKFALARLRDETRAEEAVQETFLAALKGNRSFQGRSAEKTWLTGILKNKVYDYFRKSARETSFTDLEFYDDEESDRFVTERLGSGGWIHSQAPQEWASMGESLDNDLFGKPTVTAPDGCRKGSVPCSICASSMAWKARNYVPC